MIRNYARILEGVQVEVDEILAAEQEVIARADKEADASRKKAEPESKRRAKEAEEAIERARISNKLTLACYYRNEYN